VWIAAYPRGCVTSRVLRNVKEKMEQQEELDGFSELTWKDQEDVSKALEQGELDPADQTVPVPKATNTEDEGPVTPKSKRRKRAELDSEQDEDDEQGNIGPSSPTPPPKRRPPARERKTTLVEEEEGDVDEDLAAPKKKASKRKSNAKSKVGRKRKVKAGQEADGKEDETGITEHNEEQDGENAVE